MASALSGPSKKKATVVNLAAHRQRGISSDESVAKMIAVTMGRIWLSHDELKSLRGERQYPSACHPLGGRRSRSRSYPKAARYSRSSSIFPRRSTYREVAAGDAWQKSASFNTRAWMTTPLTDTCMRVSTVDRRVPRIAAAMASMASPLLAPQKKPTEWDGALLIARMGFRAPRSGMRRIASRRRPQ